MTPGEFSLDLAIPAWGLMCGASVYEHLAVHPAWTADPPTSLAMWAGRYRIVPERFWRSIHPLVLLLLALSLALNWNDTVGWLIGVPLAVYVLLVLAPTRAWFVPELLRLVRDDAAPITQPEWRARAKRWERLSMLRAATILALSFPLVYALHQAAVR